VLAAYSCGPIHLWGPISYSGRLICLWDPASGKPRKSWQSGMEVVCSLAFSPDGRVLAGGGWQPNPQNFDVPLGEARLWDAATGKELARLHFDRSVAHVAFTPDGKVLVTACHYPLPVSLWDVAYLAKALPSGRRRATAPRGPASGR
jgi:WD40 repeat protein